MQHGTVFINGKFLAQRMTGVQRFAHGVVQALDESLAKANPDGWRFVLLTPRSAPAMPLRAIRQQPVGPQRIRLHAWEQFVLPWHARGGLLLSLAGSASLLHPRQVVTIHDAAIYDQPGAYTKPFVAWYRFLFAVAARRSPLLLTISEFSKERLARHLKRRDRVVIVSGAASHMDRQTADGQLVERLGLGAGRYWLAVGSANPTKNFARLVEAFCQLPRSLDVRLVIVGGRNGSVFSGSRSELIEDDRLLWTGPVSDAELQALYQHALAFAFPSLYEGFGLPPLEAMSCGCPVAAARAASIPEVCGDAVLYFDPNSTTSIAEALRRLTEDDELRATLSRQGRRHAGRYSWDASAAQLLRQLDAHALRPLENR